jgi:hypothetical protein
MNSILPTIAAAALTVTISAATLETSRTINRTLAWHGCPEEQQRAGLIEESYAICRRQVTN